MGRHLADRRVGFPFSLLSPSPTGYVQPKRWRANRTHARLAGKKKIRFYGESNAGLENQNLTYYH